MNVNRLSRRYIALLLLAAACASPAPSGAAQAQEGTPAKSAGTNPAAAAPGVRLVNAPDITVNQMTGTGRDVLYLRNETNEVASLALVGTVESPANSAVIVEFAALPSGKPTRVYEAELPPRTTATVAIVVRNHWNDGEFDVELANRYGAEKIGKAHVRRFPVSIKLEGAGGLKLALVDGVTSRLLLKNDDPLAYPVSWKLVNAQLVCGGNIDLGPKAAGVLKCTPDLKWEWTQLFRNLVKPDPARGGYQLYLYPRGAAPALQPVKTFAGEASINYFEASTRAYATLLVSIVLLVLGGLASLLLSYSLPNRLLGLDLREKLLALAARTADLSTRIESRLAVLVRLERSRLEDLFRTRSTWSPDFPTIASQCEKGIARLTAKVAILEQIDLVLGRLHKKLSFGVPPTKADEIDKGLQDATVLLSKGEVTDAELQAADAAVKAASGKTDNLDAPDVGFGHNLAATIAGLIVEMDKAKAASATYQHIIGQLPGPDSALKGVAANVDVPASKQVELDMAAQKMRIILAYAALRDGAADDDMKTRLDARASALISMMQYESWRDLTAARLLLRQMKEDIFPERLIEALQDPRNAVIELDPAVAYERAPLDLSVSFYQRDLNSAAARERIGVEWDFGDGLSGKGWTVSHYFLIKHIGRRGREVEANKPEKGWLSRFWDYVTHYEALVTKVDTYTVQARFRKPDGLQVLGKDDRIVAITCRVQVRPSKQGEGLGERTWAEGIKLAAALLIAVFSLLTGAQEQIDKLDLLPGLIAVFLLGFSADSIKRLLTTTKPPSSV